MRALVTGGTGFIGRWVVRDLIARGWSVRIFDLKPDASRLDDLEPGLSGKVEIVRGNIVDGSVRDAARDCDAIIHLVGVMTVDCARDPVGSASINVIGTLQVFEAALAHGIERMAYVSSAAVFGPDSATEPCPATHYGAHKLAIEGIARVYLRDHGLRSTGFRPYIVYGPGQSSGIAAGPSIACAAAMRGEAATIRFAGRAGFVHVRDVAALMVQAIVRPGDGARAYTLCGETADMSQFVAILAEHVPDADITIEGAPLPIPSDLATSSLPPELAELPVTGLRQGIASTLQFYRDRAAPKPGDGS